MKKLKVVTVVGTRPEIIRLSATIKLLDRHTDHVLVHTGQNYDYELNEVFFEDLSLRRPDHFLEADTSSLGAALGSILAKTEQVLAAERPDAFLVLGDTNSCISAVIAKRMRIPVFHMEAGNRSFDENVPEETNRRLVDHVSDYNLVYTEHARRNLLAEGIHPSRILLTGSPMREVLNQNAEQIAASDVLERQGLRRGEYFLVSLHREENVDSSIGSAPRSSRSRRSGTNTGCRCSCRRIRALGTDSSPSTRARRTALCSTRRSASTTTSSFNRRPSWCCRTAERSVRRPASSASPR